MSASDAGEDIVGASRQGIRRVSKGIVDDVLDHATNHTPILSANDSRELDASEEEFASGVQLFDGWVQYVTDDRQDVFFYNTLSHVTQWERPLPRPNVNPSTPKRPPSPIGRRRFPSDSDESSQKEADREYQKDHDMLSVLNLACDSLKGTETLNTALVQEQRLFLKGKLHGANSPAVVNMAIDLCKLYNKLAMHATGQCDFELTNHLIDRALYLTSAKSPFLLSPSVLSYRILTLNNFACALRKQGREGEALKVLAEAIGYGTQVIEGNAEHMTTCHLNRCTVFSKRKQHDKAIEDAQFAIYFAQEGIKTAGMSPKLMSDRVVALAAGYYNLAVQLEHTGRFKLCLQWYRKACALVRAHTRKRDGTRIKMETALNSAELAYGKRGKNTSGGRPQSARRYAPNKKGRAWCVTKVEPLTYAQKHVEKVQMRATSPSPHPKLRPSSARILRRGLSQKKLLQKSNTVGSIRLQTPLNVAMPLGPGTLPRQLKARAGRRAPWDMPAPVPYSASSSMGTPKKKTTTVSASILQEPKIHFDRVKGTTPHKTETSSQKRKKKKTPAKIRQGSPVARQNVQVDFLRSPTRLAKKRADIDRRLAIEAKKDAEVDQAIAAAKKSRSNRAAQKDTSKRKAQKSRAAPEMTGSAGGGQSEPVAVEQHEDQVLPPQEAVTSRRSNQATIDAAVAKYNGMVYAAVKVRDERSTHALLDGGMDPNEADNFGLNALHYAARWKSCSHFLLHRLMGATRNLNAENKYRNTALHTAAGWNHPRIVDSLIKAGVDLGVKDEYGLTPLNYAVHNDCTESIALLRAAGAQE